MKRSLFAALFAALGWPAIASELLVTNATLWTSDGPQLRREMLIRDGRVAKVGRAGRIKASAGMRIIDARGDTLLPGFIDAHVHLVSGVRLPEEFSGLERARVAARQLLRSGVTSGRVHLWDIKAATSFAAQSRKDPSVIPRLIYGGPGLFGGQPDWYSDTGNGWGVKDVADAQTKVMRLHDAGIVWVTLHDLISFEPGQAEAIVKTAHDLGMRVGAAGETFAAIERAVALGVDSIEYLDRSDAAEYPAELIARLQGRRDAPWLVPMIGFPHRFAAYRQARMDLADPRLTEFMPPRVAAFASASMREDQDQPIRLAPTWTEVPPATSAKFRQLANAGLPLVAGTDCGSPMHVQSDAMWWELETWRQLGVPLVEILRAATSRAANLLDDPAAGHLHPGAHGDFVLYRGLISDGPLSVQRVRSVAKGGVVVVDEGQWVGSEGA